MDHLGEALAPGEEVGVVLLGTDKDDPAIGRRQVPENGGPEQGRDSDAHHLLKTLDGGGGAGATEEEDVVGTEGPQPLFDVVRSFENLLGSVQAHVAVDRVSIAYTLSRLQFVNQDHRMRLRFSSSKLY